MIDIVHIYLIHIALGLMVMTSISEHLYVNYGKPLVIDTHVLLLSLSIPIHSTWCVK